MYKMVLFYVMAGAVMNGCSDSAGTDPDLAITADSALVEDAYPMPDPTIDTTKYKHTNSLIDETSPYLLQHAHNPVDWYPWGDEAFEKAKAENKMVLVSIGYSACHWCHVMEHESFEDEEVAEFMNEHFVCIKVDREERPDVDQVYMTAVQLMTGRGGWPLNCFALPDGRPTYGGTYFPKGQWMEVLNNLKNIWTTDSAQVIHYAEQLTAGVQQAELLPKATNEMTFETTQAANMVDAWARSFDTKEGGPNKAPKFPLPNNYQFLLHYAKMTGDDAIQKQVELTLDKMAYGGIYDQIGGGFARYSVDGMWKVPHFEKMLYDNGQLVSLYAQAYQATKKSLYKDIVYETLEFVDRELTSREGAFYSALDADSEGEEGKFYVWKEDELKSLLGDDFKLAAKYFNINNKGFWEHGNYILLRDKDDASIAEKFDLTEEKLLAKREDIRKKLMKARDKRIRPGLDDKTLTSWNALMLKGYVDAYLTFGEKKFLQTALKNANFITEQQLREDGGLWHNYKKGTSNINGYLEDYCFTIEAFIALHEATADEIWLTRAKGLADYALQHFLDEKTGFFYFTSDEDPPLIARKQEINDNVIPASNSSMAKALFQLGHYFDEISYLETSDQMLKNIYKQMPNYGPGYSNWGILLLWKTMPFYEIAIVGKDFEAKQQELYDHYLPNKMVIGSEKDSQLPLLELKYVDGQTTIYVCQNKTCQRPVTEVDEALKQIE